MPTWRLVKLDESGDTDEVIETAIANKSSARTSLKVAVRSFLNGEYGDNRWEVRYMPNRNSVRFRMGNGHRIIVWRIEPE